MSGAGHTAIVERLREACDRTGKPSGVHMIDGQRMIAKVMAERLDDEDAQCIAQVADCMAHCIENEALLFECLKTEALEAAKTISDLLEALEAVELARMSDDPVDWHNATELTDAAIAKATGAA